MGEGSHRCIVPMPRRGQWMFLGVKTNTVQVHGVTRGRPRILASRILGISLRRLTLVSL